MIHLIGMSHAVGVLRAYAGAASPFTHEGFAAADGPPAFHDLCGGDRPPPLDRVRAALLSPRMKIKPIAQEVVRDGRAFLVVNHLVRVLLDEVAGHGPGGVLVSQLNGNEHSVLSMVQHPVPYDFVVPGREGVGVIPGRQVLPFPVVARQVAAAFAQTVLALRVVRVIVPAGRVVHVLPPPPVPSAEHITQNREAFKALTGEHRVTPASVRLKYYWVYCDELAKALAGYRVECLPAPEPTLDPAGCLRPEYWLGATHGNEAYGRLVLDQLQHLLTPG